MDGNVLSKHIWEKNLWLREASKKKDSAANANKNEEPGWNTLSDEATLHNLPLNLGQPYR